MAESDLNKPIPEPPGALNLREAATSIEDNLEALFGDGEPTNRERLEKGEDVESDAEQPEQKDSAEEEEPEGSEEEELKQRQPDEQEDEAKETEDSADEETEDDDTEEEAEQEPELIHTVEQLAEAWDTPVEQVLEALSLTVPGQEDAVNLKELRDGYQRQSDYTKGKQQQAEDRKSFDSEVGTARQTNERNNAVMATLFQQLQQMFLAPPDSAEMDRLRLEDSNEWTARRVEYQDRQTQFQQILQGAAQNYDQQQTEYTEAAQQQFAQYIEKSKAELLQAEPGWNEESRTSLFGFIGPKYGFSEDEIRATLDPRVIRLGLDAQRWHQSQVKGQKAKKKLKAVPKIASVKSKKTRSKAQLSSDNIRKLRAKAASSGSVRDAAKVLEATLSDEIL